MHKFLFGLLAVTLATTTASAVTILPPSKAKGVKGEFVTAYNSCLVPSQTTNPPVTLPACTAVQSDTTCTWGSKGAGKYGASVSKTDIKVSASLSGLACADSTLLTATSDADVTTTDCTVDPACTATIDNFPIGACIVALGKCSIKTTVETFIGLGTNVFKEGQVLNIALGETAIFRGGTKTFVGGVRVGPK